MSQFPPKKVVAITPLAPQIDRGAPCSHINPASQGTAFGSFAVPCEAGTCFLPAGNSKMKEQRPFCRRLFLRQHHPPDREPIRSRCGIIRRPATPPKPFNTIRAKFPRTAAAIRGASDVVWPNRWLASQSRRPSPPSPKGTHAPDARPTATRRTPSSDPTRLSTMLVTR